MIRLKSRKSTHVLIMNINKLRNVYGFVQINSTRSYNVKDVSMCVSEC